MAYPYGPPHLPPAPPAATEPPRSPEATKQLAAKLRVGASAAYLTETAFKAFVPSQPDSVSHAYLESLLRDAGATQDPVEQMLIEQIVFAHHAIGMLHKRAASAPELDQIEVYHAAAARLLAEFRRSVLALKKYREPYSPKRFTVVKQQNLAQSQQVAFVQGEAPVAGPIQGTPVADHRDTQLTSKGSLEYAPATPFDAQSETSRGRARESVEAKRPQRRRKGAPPTGSDR